MEIEHSSKIVYQLEMLECCKVIINVDLLRRTRKEENNIKQANNILISINNLLKNNLVICLDRLTYYMLKFKMFFSFFSCNKVESAYRALYYRI